MSEQINQLSPHYVTCRCQHCDGHIEFDANQLTEENSVIPCPHCGLETKLFVPQTVIVPTGADPPVVRCEGFFCGDPDFEAKAPSPAETSGIPARIFTEAEPDATQKPDAQVNAQFHAREMQRAITQKLKSPRVTLTKTQSASPTGKALIELLIEIGDEGTLTDAKIVRLHKWLADNATSEIPAVAFLSRLLEQEFSTGSEPHETAFEIQLAIERVLPKEIRQNLTDKRIAAWPRSPASQSQLDYILALGGKPSATLTRAEASEYIERLAPRATERQLAFIRDLGGNASPTISKSDASELIDELLSQNQRPFAQQQPPTPRQVMVLRFWNRMDLAGTSKWEVENWLNQFYAKDPRRQTAWEIFKAEIGDDGSQHDPSFVPVGAGMEYLKKASA